MFIRFIKTGKSGRIDIKDTDAGVFFDERQHDLRTACAVTGDMAWKRQHILHSQRFLLGKRASAYSFAIGNAHACGLALKWAEIQFTH